MSNRNNARNDAEPEGELHHPLGRFPCGDRHSEAGGVLRQGRQVAVAIGLDSDAILDPFGGLSDLAARDTIEPAASPYAGADLGLLASEGWRDGFEQVQMGKQELQQTLGLATPLSGALSPDLGLTSESLACYADASIDRVVVSSGLRASLAEQVGPETAVLRARNTDGDRVTLLFADDTVSSAVGPPWDANAFGAAVAAALVAAPRDALVIAPADLFELPPAAYLERVAEALTGNGWIRSVTLEEMVALHSLGNRPVLFETEPAEPDGYIEGSIMAAVDSAHAVVSELGAAADTTKKPVELAHRLLYAAESRWWSRAGTSPQEATLGLEYAAQAQAMAEGELKKVRLVKVDSPLVRGEESTLHLVIENSADYRMSLELQLAGEGLTFPQGDRLPLDLEPGTLELALQVQREDGSQEVDVKLVAGTYVVDEFSHSVRFLRLMTVLPWLIVVAALLLMGGVYLFLRRRLRRRRESATE